MPSRKIPTLALAAAVFAAAPATRGFEAAWSPIRDQFGHALAQTQGRTIWDHKDFPAGDSLEWTRSRIATALRAAHAKGIRVLDIQFIATRSQLPEEYASDHSADPRPPAEWDRSARALAVSNEAWLLEAERFNASRPAEPVRLRLRINATAANLHRLFRAFKPFDARLAEEDPGRGRIRSRFPDLPRDPCFDTADPSDTCYRSSRVPPGYYRSRNMDGTLNPHVPNLANPAVRRGIAGWAAASIREARRLAPSSRIEEVSLSVDACSESSLFGSDTGGVVGFTRAYSRSATLEAKAGFFHEREFYLKRAYREFADSVRAAGKAAGIPVRAGVFQQPWVMDGRVRGTFDLYSLLKGTGMETLHHTQMPLDSSESLMAVAYSASVAVALGMDFDTEFSWPFFGSPVPADLAAGWDLPILNAARFLGQASAGLRYGASGITYCNWSIPHILAPPAAPLWRRLIGDGGPAYNAAHLAALKEEVAAQPLTEAESAIYISSEGRLECEEKAMHPDGPGYPCALWTYFDWFREAGWRGGGPRESPLFRRKIAILTDGMILDGRPELARFREVLIPFETSLRTSAAVLAAVESMPPEAKRRIRWQRGPADSGTGTYAEWIKATRPMAAAP